MAVLGLVPFQVNLRDMGWDKKSADRTPENFLSPVDGFDIPQDLTHGPQNGGITCVSQNLAHKGLGGTVLVLFRRFNDRFSGLFGALILNFLGLVHGQILVPGLIGKGLGNGQKQEGD